MYKLSLRNVRKCQVLSCFQGVFSVLGVSYLLSSFSAFVSMVCVEGATWIGVTLRDKVAVFRSILFVFVGDGPADPGGDTGVEVARKDMSPRMATRHAGRCEPRRLSIPTFPDPW